MTWKSLIKTTCAKCNKRFRENGFSWCPRCCRKIAKMIMASTTMTTIMTTIMTPTIKYGDMITTKISQLRFVIRWWKNWKRKREEERDNEMLIRKAGARE